MDEAQTLSLAREAIRQGNKGKGRELLVELLRANPRSETAWLWLSAVIDDPAKERECLERVLRINPANDTARSYLGRLHRSATQPGKPQQAPTPPVPQSTSPLPKPQPKSSPPEPQPGPLTSEHQTAKRHLFVPILLVVLGVVFACVCLCVGSAYFSGIKSFQSNLRLTPTPTWPATWTPVPRATSTPAPAGRTMYACGIDRCRDSGEYGRMIFFTGINVWNNPDPERGGVHHQVAHADKVTVIDERRASSGPGGLWYELADGGWINDYWLTDTPCTYSNLQEYSFTDCLMGEY